MSNGQSKEINFRRINEKQWGLISIILREKLCDMGRAAKNITTKREYMGMRRTNVIIVNAPVDISDNYLAAFFKNSYGLVEVTTLRGGKGTANGDYSLLLCLKRDGFQSIPDTIQFRNQTLMIVPTTSCINSKVTWLKLVTAKKRKQLKYQKLKDTQRLDEGNKKRP